MRAGGPGGQHQNTSDTAVALSLDVAQSASLGEETKTVLADKLASRLDSRGVLTVVSRESRSQKTNRDLAQRRLLSLLRDALRPRKARRPTRVPNGVRRKRLENKRQRSEVKRMRTRPGRDG